MRYSLCRSTYLKAHRLKNILQIPAEACSVRLEGIKTGYGKDRRYMNHFKGKKELITAKPIFSGQVHFSCTPATSNIR